MSRKSAADRQHRWLSLVDVTGVVLSEPVLVDAAPAGFRSLERAELARFYREREIRDLPIGSTQEPERHWADFILHDLLRLKPKYWRSGSDIPETLTAPLPSQGETLRPTRVLYDGGEPVLALLEVPRGQSLDSPWRTTGAWKASPTTKLERLLRSTGIEAGLLTNGDSWRLVVASPSETASWLTWTVESWVDSPSTLAAFVELLGEARFFAGPREGTILALIRASRARQADVADQLGTQARDALTLFVRELDRLDERTNGELLEGYSLEEVYAAGVALMMRFLFILKAEEMLLLPHGAVAYDTSYGLLHLLNRLEHQHRLVPEALQDSTEGYAQMLATFRLIHAGSPDPDLNIAAYGGSLFDPTAFPLLEGRCRDGSMVGGCVPLGVTDAALRRILRSFKYARRPGGVPQWVSYRTLEVEQIGHMYEGLLDRAVHRGPRDETILLLQPGEPNTVPRMPLTRFRTESSDEEIAALVAGESARSLTSVRTAMKRAAIPPEAPLAERLTPLLKSGGVVRPGGLFVAEGLDRRTQGAHYTPPSLTDPIVRKTVDPLLRQGSAKEVLDLRICDPAMGSGAFLVQVVRVLGDRLADAWDAAVTGAEGKPLTLPYGDISTGEEGERLLPETREERVLWARRYIAERCVYGVDRTPLAVEMAKLSLWLVTLAKERPFTFLDHSLRCGDSLLGIATPEQLRTWSWDEKGSSAPIFEELLRKKIDAAILAREAIERMATVSVVDAQQKATQLRLADRGLHDVRAAGDLLLASFFNGTTSNARRHLAGDYLIRWATTPKDVEELARTTLAGRRTFHWPVEFPEIFFSQGGFSAVVGNPPFTGGHLISGVSGAVYRAFLVEAVAHGERGAADLVAYFFLRAYSLVRAGGTIGFLATKTIAEGDTRDVGLTQLTRVGAEIYAAYPNMPWPGEAAVVVTQVHIFKGVWNGPRQLGATTVDKISSALSSGAEIVLETLPRSCGIAFQGTTTLGMGFTLSAEQAQAMITNDARNSVVLRPFLNGEDLNDIPDQSARRWIVTFWDWPESAAAQFPEPFEWVRSNVYDERLKKSQEKASYASLMDRWWLFWRPRAELYHALGRGGVFKKHPRGYDASTTVPLTRVLVNVRHSKTVAFVFVDPDQVFSDALNVFATEDAADFAILQSTVHSTFAWRTAGKLKHDLRYSPSDCFETFPLPSIDDSVRSSLRDVGEQYHAARSTAMATRGVGLTALYTLIHNPAVEEADIVELRDLHRVVDRAICAAYQWTDIGQTHVFEEVDYLPKEDRMRFTLPAHERDEIFGRLAALNRQESAAD